MTIQNSTATRAKVAAIVAVSFILISSAHAQPINATSNDPGVNLFGNGVTPLPPTFGADANATSPWNVTVGLGAGVRPAYPGASKERAYPAPLVDVTYDNRFFASTSRGIGAYAINTSQIQVGAAIGYDGEARYSGDSARLNGLPKIKPGAAATVFGSYRVGPFAVNADVRERIGPVNGVSATLGAAYGFRAAPNWVFAFGPSVTWQEASLNNGFFGVTAGEALNAARFGNFVRPYQPGSGLRDVSLNLTSRYQIDQNWGVQSLLRLGFLVGDDANSPLVRQNLQPGALALVYYHF